MSDLEIRPLQPDEVGLAAELGHYAWPHRSPEDRARDFGRRVDPEREVLVAVTDGEIVGQVHIHTMGVWFDGVRYSSGGFTNVVIAPERTRHGYATQLLEASLRWMREVLGHAFSTLYPTVYPLYSKLGWIQAEDGCRFIGPPAAFRPSDRLPTDPGGRVVRRRAQIDDIELLEPIYREFARPRRGYLDRPRWYWEDYVVRHRHGADPRWLALWYGSDQRLAGYALYAFDRDGSSGATLSVRDLISLRPEGYQALLSFLASHHLWPRLTIDGGRDVPWGLLVGNPQELKTEGEPGDGFMLRVVDLPRVVDRRPVRPGSVVPDAVIRVHDAAAPWNDGIWLIGPGSGCWHCERLADRPVDASVDIRFFAALFAGSLTVRQAVDLGFLSATAAVCPTLEALFGGQYLPHSGDHF
jgi:predicted acetyltransferase